MGIDSGYGIGSVKPGVCTSTTRPASPFDGQTVYMTDVDQTAVWDGMSWVVLAPIASGRNVVINGAMQVAQRGTSTAGVTTGTTYNTADRWRVMNNALGVWTQSVENDAPTGSGFRKSLKMLCTTADASPASTDYCIVNQSLEGQNIQQFAKGTASAKQFALSFWVKSNVTGTYIAQIWDTDNSRTVSASYTISASATWEKKTIIFPADTSGAWNNDNNESVQMRWWLASGSAFTSGTLETTWAAGVDANAAVGQTNVASATNNYWQVTGVQLEAGAVATSFEFEDYGTTLQKCLRYFEKNSNSSAAVGNSMDLTTYIGSCWYIDGWPAPINIPFKVPKRTTPTITFYGPSGQASGWYVYSHNFTQYAARGTNLYESKENSFIANVSTWNGSSGTLGFGIGASYRVEGAWTASAEL